MGIFHKIFDNYTTGKSADFGDAYEDCFSSIRKDVKLFFEIGVNKGQSILGWREFFPNATVVGIEVDRKRIECDMHNIEIGDATNKNFIESVLQKYGLPDIVIDDGSHLSNDIKDTYKLLYDKTKFCYVIEDIGTQYMSYGNGCYINDNQPATKIVHDKIDNLLQYKETCKSIKIYHSICFIFK